MSKVTICKIEVPSLDTTIAKGFGPFRDKFSFLIVKDGYNRFFSITTNGVEIRVLQLATTFWSESSVVEICGEMSFDDFNLNIWNKTSFSSKYSKYTSQWSDDVLSIMTALFSSQ